MRRFFNRMYAQKLIVFDVEGTFLRINGFLRTTVISSTEFEFYALHECGDYLRILCLELCTEKE